MSIVTHTLGYPRIGVARELKHAVEAYWAGKSSLEQLETVGRELRARHWAEQQVAGLTFVTVGDFSYYDHILDTSALLGAVPHRFGQADDTAVSLDTVFRMGRGRAPSGEPAAACEMTKWFDTNYHYMVPELYPNQTFRIARESLFEQVREARTLGHTVKAVLPGPLTWLWLGKTQGEFDKLSLLDALLPVYTQVLSRLKEAGAEWVQLDEPILALDLPATWKQAFEASYTHLKAAPVKKLLATYFGGLEDNLGLAAGLPVDGLHVDLVRAPDQLTAVLDRVPAYKVLSLGVIDGRNIWRSDLPALRDALQDVALRLGDRLWLAPSCSLLHVPQDLQGETELDPELRSWLAFAKQKLDELRLLAGALEGRLNGQDEQAFGDAGQAAQSRRISPRIHKPAVQARLRALTPADRARPSPYTVRARRQQDWLKLPLFPTTTIGSFPQTAEIRSARRQFKNGAINEDSYVQRMQFEILDCVRRQEQLDIDVLVHGEAERNDMVEYFGEQLDGYAFTANGWVQSYGSRCVKPPVIYGDVVRPRAMTLSWTQYAQSLTTRPMKGMLTGPVTMLQWAFVRDDQARAQTCRQIALALRDEVDDLQKGGIHVIQIDEPALREGLPLRRRDWPGYLDWAVECFQLCAAVAEDRTQVHTHMCYSEFNDIIEAIAALDADVITIETSRSNMELLEAFERFEYPNQIGPGVYDIHSPNIPDTDWMVRLMEKAADRLPVERLWVNPDCGLKTRRWEEVEPALAGMVLAAKILRERFA